MWRPIILIAGLLLISAPALADSDATHQPGSSTILEQTSCLPWSEIKAQSEADGWRNVQLTPIQRSNFLEAFNAMDPPTNEQPEQLWIGEKQGSPVLYIVFVDHGCITDGGPVSPEKFMEMIKGHSA